VTPDLGWLLGGALALITLSFALSRALRGRQHGFSIRLQLFAAITFAALCSTALIGWWALERIEARAAQLFAARGPSAEVLQEFIKDFGSKTSLLFGVICLISAGSAFALGRLLAGPIERLSRAAEGISRGAALPAAPLPPPSGREVRHLTEALDAMLRALEDRQRFERFIADLSHDLKNPVSAIRASTEVLLHGAADDPETRARFLGRIDEAGARLDRILSDFLSLARLEARGLKPDPAPWAVRDALERAAGALGAAAELKGVRVELRFADDAARDARAHGSRTWVTRAVENLLSNAVRYSPPNGRVEVTARLDPARGCVLEVRDEGPGVDPALRAVLFERFVTDWGGVSPSGGSGLGLAIVKRVFEAHGGGARLLEAGESEGGARFEVWWALSAPC